MTRNLKTGQYNSAFRRAVKPFKEHFRKEQEMLRDYQTTHHNSAWL